MDNLQNYIETSIIKHQNNVKTVATNTLNIVLYWLILWSAQEIAESYETMSCGPGLIRLLTIEVWWACRIALALTLWPKKTLLPESLLFIENSIQLFQYKLYEL